MSFFGQVSFGGAFDLVATAQERCGAYRFSSTTLPR